MVECCESPQKHHSAIFEKYNDKRYKRASQFVESEMRKGFQVLDVASDKAVTFATMYDSQPIWDPK